VNTSLVIPFEARGGSGQVTVSVGEVADPTTVGHDSGAAGFPVCRASVDFSLDGYDGFVGWVQLNGIRTDAGTERVFELDPLEVFASLKTPFAFYGLSPELFDAPYARDRSRYVDWLFHSFLCVAPTRPMAREVEAVLGFSWGFNMVDGGIAIAQPEMLQPADWSGHVHALSELFPSWTFSDAHTW
jgi:hypothetical protein